MRVLHINDVGSRAGGAETNIFSVMSLFQKNNHEQYLCAFQAEGEIKRGARIIRSDKGRRFMRELSFGLIDLSLYGNQSIYRMLAEHIGEVDPDVIHVHNNFLYTNTVLKAVAESGKPVVQSAHDYGIVCPTAWCMTQSGVECEGGFGLKCLSRGCMWTKKFIREYGPRKKAEHLMGKTVNAFICPSRGIQNKLNENGFENTVYVPYFVFPERFDHNPEMIEDGFVLFVGVLFPQKGAGYLIEAMPAVVREHPEAVLHVIGDGPERAKLEEKAGRLLPKEKVFFHGRLEQDDLPEIYSQANVVIFPSVWVEQFGIVGLEAMASGRPVVGSDVGGVSEWLTDGETGFLVKTRNPADIAEKVNTILGDKKNAVTMGARGRRNCEKQFSADVVYPKLLEVYESVAR